MAHLRITITVTVPLPRNATAAARLGILLGQNAADAARSLAQIDEDAAYVCSVTAEDATDTAPAPAPKRRGRKPRAALGSSPLASAAAVDGVSRQTAINAARAAEPHPPTTGADGEDLLAIPPHLVRP